MRNNRTVRVTSIFVVLLMGILLGAPAVIFAAHSASPGSLRTVIRDEDRFRNWDFWAYQDDEDHVDWPVTMLFYDNAEVDKVKINIYWGLCLATPMAAKLDDGNGWFWDTDQGTKNPCACLAEGDAPHMRLYAGANDVLFNDSWGYYVLGTTHIDHAECNVQQRWSGESEQAEGFMAQHARNKGYTVFEDWSNFLNADGPRQVGDHKVNNNGLATAVNVP